jgi:molybdenum cofactor cytidylyltransferase
MEFGPVPLDNAEGAILAHSVAMGPKRMRKGRVLKAEDIEALRAAGVAEVVVARLGAGDVHEDEAALRLARAVVPDPAAAGLALRVMGTGRVNIHAEAAGVAEVLADRINGVNATDPAITIATVPEWQRMEPGGMVATVKIIAYAVPESALAEACHAGAGALGMRPAVIGGAVLIQTSVGAEDGEKGQRVIGQRLERLGVTLGPKQVVAHRVADLSAALAAATADAGLILILTGSATSDIRDVAPEAVRRAGGGVSHFGMPVDPGNLLFLGRIGARPVIGLPGCARSPALNGADWVIERIVCGLDVTPGDIAAMGVGGLLKEIPTRPRPREAR